MNASGSFTEQRARFELLGGIGAAVLGAGVGLVFRDLVAALAFPLLIVGLIVHGWAMWGKHRLDASGSIALPRWTVWAYWTCWALIAGLAVYAASVVW
jgi:hypothetical protein